MAELKKDLVAVDLDHMEISRKIANHLKKSHADVFKKPPECFAVKKAVPKLKNNAVPVFGKKKPILFVAMPESRKEID